MKWPKQIERWRRIAASVAPDIPTDLLLAIINNESNGQPGIPAGKKTPVCVALPTSTGGSKTVCRAYGLMQTVPATIDFYNRSNKTVTFNQISGSTDSDAAAQIAVGAFYLRFVNDYLNHKFPTDLPAKEVKDADLNQLKLVLTGYAVGHGAIEDKLSALSRRGAALTYDNVKRYFPTWGQNKKGVWVNRPLFYAAKISALYTGQKAPAVYPVIKKKIKPNEPGGGFGFFLPVVLIGIALYSKIR